MVKAKTAGSFLGSIFNNPGIVLLGALAIGLFIFKDPIQKAFASLGESFGKIELPAITLPEINITNPLDLSGFGADLRKDFDNFVSNFKNPLDLSEQGADFREDVDQTFTDIGTTLADIPDRLKEIFDNIIPQAEPSEDQTDFTASGQAAARARQSEEEAAAIIQEPSTGFLSPREQAEAISRGDLEPFFITSEEIPVIPTGLGADTGFFGGGISFMGGETTPIETLSLSQIIDLGLADSASQAANLKAIAEGFTKEEEEFLRTGIFT